MSNTEAHAPHLGVHHRPISHQRQKNRHNGSVRQRQPAQRADETAELFGRWVCRRMVAADDVRAWGHIANVLTEGHALGDLDGVVLRRFFKQCPHEDLKRHLREQVGKEALDVLLGTAPSENEEGNGRSKKFRRRGSVPHNGNGHG